MSGIVGIVNLDGAPIDSDLLWRMTDFMSYRGPDGREIWTDENVGLGHTLLTTTWEAETEKQPLTLDGSVWLTADARIDGRAELIVELEGKLGRLPPSSNDAELILYAYGAWGEDCVKHLIGDFAFAIWDARRKRLFCARDHFGVKPFFFARIRDSFIFSNTLNTLRLDARVSDELNEIAIGDFLLRGLNQDLSTTTFRDIRRLAPGHSLSLLNYSITSRRYWIPTGAEQLRFKNRDTYVEHFEQLLTRAIDDRLRTNRMAVSMSGGLDSTSVAAIASGLLKQQPVPSTLQAFTAVYDSLIPDEERRYSTMAAAGIGVPITHLNAGRYSLFEAQLLGDLDQAEPFLLSPLAGQFNDLMRLFAECGRVTLTGWDGDAFMSEPPKSYFASAAKKLKIKDLFTGMAWFVWAHHSLPPVGFRTRLKRMIGKHPPETLYPEWIDESFATRINLRERCEQFASESVGCGETRPVAWRALNSKVWASLFEGYDAGATRLPLEMRHPLIDVRLVEYLLAIPAVPWCVNKHILRLAMKNRLPAQVLNRKKTPLAGDPALQLARDASVRWLDSFEVTPQLKDFVNLNLRRSLANEPTPDGLWANLRLFALNHWLTHSLPINRQTVNKNPTGKKQTEGLVASLS